MSEEQEIKLSEREKALVQAYADEHGISLDEAATRLMHDAIALKFRKNLNRAPAKVYSLPRKKS